MRFLTKYWFYTLSAVVFIAVTVFTVVYMEYIKVKEGVILQQKYEQTAQEIHSQIADLVHMKEKSTLAVALSLAGNEKTKAPLLNKQIDEKYFTQLIQFYKDNTLYKNIWIQIVDKNGVSVYRSWTDKKGDRLVKLRKEIAIILKEHKALFTISAGRYDLSIKAIAPVFHQGEFIGFIEIISHFNSIANLLKHENIDSVVVTKREYSKRITHPFTKRVVNGYYIANFNAPKPLIQLLLKNDNDLETFAEKKYFIKEGYFIVPYPLKNTEDETIGYYFAFKKLDLIKSRELKSFQFQWVVFTLLFFMAIAGVINIAMYFNMRKQKIYYKNILDSSNNIILINNKKRIVEVNKVFFKYFSSYKSLDDFRKKNICICNFFVDEEGYLSKGSSAYSWLDEVVNHPDEMHKVKMNIEGKIYFFLVNASLVSKEDNYYSITFADITKEEEYKKKLEELTIKDTLTGVYNRRFYEAEIDKEIANAKRYGYPLSLIMMDIDFFKKVNDEHGHSVGDEVLIYYTGLINGALREGDKLCRVGGEEFIIILPHTTKADAVKTAQKLRKMVEESKKILPITMSFGVTEYIKGESKDFLYKRVDEALYKAKQSGRNRVVTI